MVNIRLLSQTHWVDVLKLCIKCIKVTRFEKGFFLKCFHLGENRNRYFGIKKKLLDFL